MARTGRTGDEDPGIIRYFTRRFRTPELGQAPEVPRNVTERHIVYNKSPRAVEYIGHRARRETGDFMCEHGDDRFGVDALGARTTCKMTWGCPYTLP